jgi:hypothetical protein
MFCGMLIHQRRGNRAVGSGGFLFYACYCSSLLRGWCVVYVGDASVSIYLILLVTLGPGIHSASNRNEYQKHANNVSGE